MAILPIRTEPDSILTLKSKRLSTIDKAIQMLIHNMLETMNAANGVGLAAPQIGTLLRVIVISIPGEDIITLINPKIARKTGDRLINEGCLSIPGYIGQIKRSVSVTVKGRDQNGKKIRIKANGLLAQALEHEIDHINGVLYINYLDSKDNLRKIEPEEAQL
jgi:peptide deformylase